LLAQVVLGFGVRNVVQCREVAEALAKMEKELFDLIIVDGEMPEQDGFHLTHQVRAQPSGPNHTVPILLVSGFTPRDKIIRARDAGANLVVTKPIVPGVLLSRIEWLAKSRRQFVSSPNYCGPDRRFKKQGPPLGMEERRAEAIRLTAQPERAMSQDDINALFG
jgi:DNA-binding response OmpR family regulator